MLAFSAVLVGLVFSQWQINGAFIPLGSWVAQPHRTLDHLEFVEHAED